MSLATKETVRLAGERLARVSHQVHGVVPTSASVGYSARGPRKEVTRPPPLGVGVSVAVGAGATVAGGQGGCRGMNCNAIE